MLKKTAFVHFVIFSLLFITVMLLLVRTRVIVSKGQAAGPVCSTLPISVPVVVSGYFPPDPNNPTQLDPVETGWTPQKLQAYSGKSSMSIQQWQSNVNQMASTMSQVVSNGTRYHGYKDPNAPAFLNYQIIATKFFNNAIPHSTYTVSESPNNLFRRDYNRTMQDINVCNYVDVQGVKEIWVYGYHSGVISPDESRLSSQYGDVSNSFPHDPGFPQQFRLPKCQHSYIMFNMEMWPTPSFIDNTVHVRLHQIENEIGFAAESSSFQITWPPTPWSASNMFWNDFATNPAQKGYTNQLSCGNTHVPPNTATAYDYANTTTVSSNCETWNPDPTKSISASVSCQNWGCTTLGYYTWWMQNIPGFNNGIVFQGQQMRNWWEAMYDYNAFIVQGRSLFGQSIFSCVTTPTPVQSPSPTLSPTLTPGISITPAVSPTPSPTDTPTPTPTIIPSPQISPTNTVIPTQPISSVPTPGNTTTPAPTSAGKDGAVCSKNPKTDCSFTNNCSTYPNGTRCEHGVNGCGKSSSGNNVYICTNGTWVYDHWTQDGTCHFCGEGGTHKKPTPTCSPDRGFQVQDLLFMQKHDCNGSNNKNNDNAHNDQSAKQHSIMDNVIQFFQNIFK